ncbi:hypothetical protein XPA_002684 [Xanthoria parietina]
MEESGMHQVVRRRNRYASHNRRRPCSKATDPIPSPHMPTCLPGPDGYPRAANGQRVSQCRDGSFCCGKGSDASRCCNGRRGVFIANGTIIATNPSSSAPESKSSVTSSWSPPTSLSLPSVTTISQGDPTSGVDSPSPPSTSASSQSPRPNHLVPIIAGILGGVIGLLLLIGTIVWLFRRKRKGSEQSSSMEDSIVILDTAQTTPTRQQSRRGKHPQPIRHMKRINGTVRPPEFQGMAENEVWDRVIFVDQLGGAVRQMGF